MMNKIFSVLGMCSLLVFASCQKDDSSGATPARPHAEVYPEDLAKIEAYLKANYVEVNDTNLNGEVEVGEVTIAPKDATHTVSIWDQTTYPLLSKIVKLYDIDFKVYYLKLDTKGDTDADGDKPSGVDKILASYNGLLLDGTQFEYTPNAVELNLIETVKGWSYTFPEFRAGVNTLNGDGTITHSNFGSGIMFLPSGLGYYNRITAKIPAYSPLVFIFNLNKVTYLDHDNDKIPSRYEYVINADGTLLDSDGDKIPDFGDEDDDQDGYLTKNEIKYDVTDNSTTPSTVRTFYYPYFGASVDDPATPLVDETQGIPRCFTGPGSTPVPADFTEPARVRRHLDINCKPPYGG
ncbi:FKBP-type peptidyl-prolyl cis-trans isomerase [Flavobacterium pedocola]